MVSKLLIHFTAVKHFGRGIQNLQIRVYVNCKRLILPLTAIHSKHSVDAQVLFGLWSVVDLVRHGLRLALYIVVVV